MTKRDGPASTNAHSSRVQQRKRECAPHPGQSTAVRSQIAVSQFQETRCAPTAGLRLAMGARLV